MPVTRLGVDIELVWPDERLGRRRNAIDSARPARGALRARRCIHREAAHIQVPVLDASVKHVHVAEERHHKLVRGATEHNLRRANLLDTARVHHHDAIRDLERLLLVVRDEHRGHADVVVQAPEPAPQLLPHASVERTERLIEQQNLRLGCERPSERDALALAAGELVGIARRQAIEPEEREQLRDLLGDAGLGLLAHAQRKPDIGGDRHVLEQGVVLKDEADAAGAHIEPGRLAAGDPDATRVVALESGDDPQKRRLARTRWAQERDELTRAYLETHVLQRLKPAKGARDAGDLYACLLDVRVVVHQFSSIAALVRSRELTHPSSFWAAIVATASSVSGTAAANAAVVW